MKETPNPCPRCEGEMVILDAPGNARSFPSASLQCSTEGCLWNMTCIYDELSGTTFEEASRNLIQQWNEGLSRYND